MTNWQEIRLLAAIAIIATLAIGAIVSSSAYATGANPKTPEKEIEGAYDSSNPAVAELASGGICKIDENIDNQEARLEVDYSQPLKDKLKLETIRNLNDTVAVANSNTEPGEELTVLGNEEDC